MPTGQDIYKKAMTQKGDPYVFGVEVDLNDPNPDEFDCSELVQWVCHQLKVKPEVPDGAYNQFHHCEKGGRMLDIEDAFKTVGALLFRISGPEGGNHVAISGPGNTTIEARGKKWGVGVWSAENRPWTDAGLIPGVHYDGWEDA